MTPISTQIRTFLALILCFGAFPGTGCAAESDPDGAIYQASENPLADVQKALTRAQSQDQLALVVLGANWCHDSRALAARLNRAPLAEVIEAQYELVFVDVGFYELDRDVTQQFGVAHYYATPTVLIVDPSSGQVVNGEDRHIWGDAARISMSSSVDYFDKWATHDALKESSEVPAELQRIYAEIDEFEQKLADRVAAGYAVVGPMLADYKAGNEHDHFDANWDELRDFRMAIPADIRQLRDEAQRRVADGETDLQLEFPEYGPLSWESRD